MKKEIFALILVLLTQTAFGQDYWMNIPKNNFNNQKWSFDLGFLGSVNLSQKLTYNNPSGNYDNPINASIKSPKFNGGSLTGIEATGGYFFGLKKMFGLGTGVIFLQQTGKITQDSIHIEYQSQDFQGKTFRQIISSNGQIQESINLSNLNIPLLFKFRKKISGFIGFSADLGFLFNPNLKSFTVKNSYTTTASFDYEAIYQYLRDANGNYIAVYDNSQIPSSSNDWFITKKQYQDSNPNNMVSQFDSLNKQGYFVGLKVKPKNNTGNNPTSKFSGGIIFRPQVNLYLNRSISVNLGGYYLYQQSTNSSNNNYRITDKVGSYNSMLNGVTKTTTQSGGFNLGISILIGRKDSDGDGIPDRKDWCPLSPGPRIFNGCPDSDGDGIPDINDSCPQQAGSVATFGCPDTDGDGVADKWDKCPGTPLKVKVDKNGCPLDKDKDGIADYLDDCPDIKGVNENFGCPIYFTDSILQFPKGKSTLTNSANVLLDSCIKMLKKNPNVYLSIVGFDKAGKPATNKFLTQTRAHTIEDYLTKKNIKMWRVQIDETIKASELSRENRKHALIVLRFKLN